MSLPLFLQDKRFLHELDKLPIKQQYIKITVLNWQEQPIQQVQGKCISGNINIDGSSSMRRTATLSILADEKENNLEQLDHLFAINKKCTIELGIVNKVIPYTFSVLDNNINKSIFKTINYQENYGEIVWFPLGLFIMFNPSIAHNLSGITISMNLKDKMCLLNGDLAGQIHSSVNFAVQDQVVDDDGNSIEKKYTLIYNIIKQLVNHWGNESLNKIIISEVPPQIKMAVRWMDKDNPVYLLRRRSESYLSTDFKKVVQERKKLNLKNNQLIYKYNFSENIGFVYQDFTYPIATNGKSQLICNAGDTVTSVLDKIINILGNYEYFYDVQGNFVFQEKKNNLNMSNTAYWNKEIYNNKDNQYYNDSIVVVSGTEEDPVPKEIPLNTYIQYQDLPSDTYEQDLIRLNKPLYSFVYNEYVTNYNNSLNYNNIKNDFVVWGLRKNTTDNKTTSTPVRFHLAIDKKPDIGFSHYIILYTDSYGTVRAKGSTESNSKAILRVSSDWRQELYYQMLEAEKTGIDENTELNNNYFQYYAELKEQFPKIFDLTTNNIKDNATYAKGYKTDLTYYPEQIDYYLDFIDVDSKLGQYNVKNIGRRPKIISSNENINCVFEPTIPDIVYVPALTGEQTEEQLAKRQQQIKMLQDYGQDYIEISQDLMDRFATGLNYNSCFEKIKDLLYQYSSMNNTISITALPVYYLQPNTRITVEDGPSGIEGDFIIQSISIPLDISSTMTINASKALSKI